MVPSGHTPVLLHELLDLLAPKPGDTVFDGTVGGGGHAEALLEAIGPSGTLVGCDRDPRAIPVARERLARFGERVVLSHGSYEDAPDLLAQVPGMPPVSRIVLDLGFSSMTIDDGKRGFSFRAVDEDLDMRYDPSSAGMTAADLLATVTPEELERIFREYGEEPLARKLANAITDQRADMPITKVGHLVDLVLAVYGRRHYRERSRTHPATRVFQALRIATNNELQRLTRALPLLTALLAPGGRIAVITFHSLEDRIVKTHFRQESRDCICPPEFPECRCGHKATLTILTHHVVTPSSEEEHENPRSRSAKLRVAEKRKPS